MDKSDEKVFREIYGTWALIAGAAEGIGEGFTESLAKRGMNLVIVDVNREVLHSLGARMMKTYNIMIREIHLDLLGKDAWEQCMKAVQGLDCRLLIYIPAYSRVKTFLSNSQDELDKYLDLNCRTPIHLVHSFIMSVKDKKPAGILLMSSLAGLIGPPYLAPYASTKAFNILFTESLGSEISESNIKISVCCAGQTSTPAYLSSKPAGGGKWPPVMSPEKVADYALKKMRKRTIIIPGWQNRFSYFLLTRILPRSFAVKIVSKSMKRLYPEISSEI